MNFFPLTSFHFKNFEIFSLLVKEEKDRTVSFCNEAPFE